MARSCRGDRPAVVLRLRRARWQHLRHRRAAVRHLLDLAACEPDGRLVTPVNQQDLANGVGSVREVVARILEELRAASLVRTSPARGDPRAINDVREDRIASLREVDPAWPETPPFDKRTMAGWTRSVTEPISGDGSRAISGSGYRTVRVWEVDRGQPLATFSGEGGITACRITPSGTTMIAADASGQLHILELMLPHTPTDWNSSAATP